MTDGPRLRPAWYRVDPPTAGSTEVVRNGADELVVFAHGDGIGALDAWCPHRGAHLAAGSVTDEGVVCPLHGWCWAADGANVSGGGDGPHPSVSASSHATGGNVDRPLVWLGAEPPDHDPVDLAAGLPDDPAVDLEVRIDLGGIDPALIIENAFDAAHVPVVHGRAALDVGDATIGGNRATILHRDPERETTTTFDAYRASQMLVRVGTARDDVDLWVLFAVVAGSTTTASVRYVAATDEAEGALTRFAKLHRRELERDLALFATQRPDHGRFWGPHDHALRTYREWIDGFGP